jgi:hypothetical protein
MSHRAHSDRETLSTRAGTLARARHALCSDEISTTVMTPRTLKGVIEMTQQQAQERAARLGLSIWEVEAVQVGQEASETVRLKCCGFAALDLPLGEGETWEEAVRQATRVIFAA